MGDLVLRGWVWLLAPGPVAPALRQALLSVQAVVGGAMLAWLGWHPDGVYGLALLLWGALLVACGQPVRVWLAAWAYYLVLGWGEAQAAQAYWGWGWWAAQALWLVHAALNALAWALPFALLALLPFRSSAWAAAAAVAAGHVLSLLGPWATLSWGHPLLATADWLPGSGLAGVGVALLWQCVAAALIGLSLQRRAGSRAWLAWVVATLAVGIIWHLAVHQPRQREQARDEVLWHVLAPEGGSPQRPSEMVQRFGWLRASLQQAQQQLPAPAVIVLPEGAVGPWRDSLRAWLESRQESLRQSGHIVLLQADVADALQGLASNQFSGTIKNTVMAYGASPAGAIYVSRRPLPAGWARERGASGDADRAPVVEVAGRRVALAVCYEGLLLEHWLRAAVGSPEKVVVMANHAFVASSVPRQRQEMAYRRGARLLGAPLVMAVARPA